MMPTRLLLTGAIVPTLLLAGAPRTAHAGCCDDFFGCLGAVATLGGSCVVDAITSGVADVGTRGRDAVFGRGRLDACRAVHAATRKNVCAAR